MANPRTKLCLIDSKGNVVIDDFEVKSCVGCISECHKAGKRIIDCQLDGLQYRVFFTSDEKGRLYVCDNKEKTTKNFLTLVELIKHCRPFLLDRYNTLAPDIQRAAFKELDAFEHNIIHINAEAINEFYSYITQDTLVTKYWKLQELIEENINKNKGEAVELIAKLARHNLRIKTELSVMAKLSNPDGKPSFNLGKPRDAIMSNIYMHYPMFNKRNVYVKVKENWDKFNIDYDALQVASFYIIENATKYTEKSSTLNIDFLMTPHQFSIVFTMNSLYVEPAEVNLIFEEGYRGTEAQKTKRGGKGIGLYRAKRIVEFFNGKLWLEAGTDVHDGKDGLIYAYNKFIIALPVSLPVA